MFYFDFFKHKGTSSQKSTDFSKVSIPWTFVNLCSCVLILTSWRVLLQYVLTILHNQIQPRFQRSEISIE